MGNAKRSDSEGGGRSPLRGLFDTIGMGSIPTTSELARLNVPEAKRAEIRELGRKCAALRNQNDNNTAKAVALEAYVDLVEELGGDDDPPAKPDPEAMAKNLPRW